MRIVRRLLAVTLAVLLAAPAAAQARGLAVSFDQTSGDAQTHVISRAALTRAIAERVSQDEADRGAIVALLQRAEVRQIAAAAGLSIEKAATALSTLEGDALRDLASQARQVQNDLAGGASTVVISTTTIIIVLLLIILIVALAD